MSYYTKLEVSIFGDNSGDEGFCSKVVEFAKNAKIVDAGGWASNSGWATEGGYLEIEQNELKQAMSGEFTEMHGYIDKFLALFLVLSAEFSDTVFGVRGFGEEFDDVWIFYFKDGKSFDSYPE
ncbi:hypothetical protein [Rugamonas rivuli]|uniref:Uncharacterized protein n=1 Tax=Rugamonas rivuli TaxID=2743358 RepID=A0A843S735_9BURK|nr:hypothetical protein [Rugamonas rivuli]MQA18020.1 hypothetical protein [Rugamonas rivuli]